MTRPLTHQLVNKGERARAQPPGPPPAGASALLMKSCSSGVLMLARCAPCIRHCVSASSQLRRVEKCL